MIKKPMKAPGEGVTVKQLGEMEYPIACSAKLDGIRAIIHNDGVLSATKKRLGNDYVQQKLNDVKLLGLDGELVVGLPYRDLTNPDDDVFNRTSGAIRRKTGEPDFKFYVFDQFQDKDLSYNDRWITYQDTLRSLIDNPFVVLLPQIICTTVEEALAYEDTLLTQGYEGMMARTLTATYKEGRVTINEGYIYKRKPLEQDEAKIIGLFEQMENQNEKTVDALGRSVRSSHKDNKKGKGTLGGYILQSERWEKPFRCGTIIGGTVDYRQKIWDNPKLALEQYVTYLYQGYGSIDAPRQPRCKAEFRMPEDMTDF